MGTEFSVRSSDEPSFDIEDDLDRVLADIGGWAYLLRLAQADYHWYDAVIAPENLEPFADGCEVLAEEHADPSRRRSGDATERMRAWTVSGIDLGEALVEMARIGRVAGKSHVPLTIRSDGGWVEQTWWQATEDRGEDGTTQHPPEPGPRP
jgi:hypothetical protein